MKNLISTLFNAPRIRRVPGHARVIAPTMTRHEETIGNILRELVTPRVLLAYSMLWLSGFVAFSLLLKKVL